MTAKQTILGLPAEQERHLPVVCRWYCRGNPEAMAQVLMVLFEVCTATGGHFPIADIQLVLKKISRWESYRSHDCLSVAPPK